MMGDHLTSTDSPPEEIVAPASEPAVRRVRNTESYIRSTDGARMIAIEPHTYVNEAVWKKLGTIR